MTPRDTLQRLLIEHRTAHDPASSEREILRMFESIREQCKSRTLQIIEWQRNDYNSTQIESILSELRNGL